MLLDFLGLLLMSCYGYVIVIMTWSLIKAIFTPSPKLLEEVPNNFGTLEHTEHLQDQFG